VSYSRTGFHASAYSTTTMAGVHFDQLTSRNGLLMIIQIVCGVLLFSIGYSLYGGSDAMRWLRLCAFLFYANGAMLLLSSVISGGGIEGNFYHKLYHFVALVLYIGLPVWSIIDGDPKRSNDTGRYWGVIAISFVAAFVHGAHGVFNLRG